MVHIRPATEDDAEVIAAFQLEMALETENLTLNTDIVEQGVLQVFRNPAKGKYLVACFDEVIAGSLLLTYEWSDWRNKTVVWIQSVYVRPEYRRKGVFLKMYTTVKQMITDDSTFAGIRLYVDRTNKQAQEVYQKCGMNGNHYQLFEWMKEG